LQKVKLQRGETNEFGKTMEKNFRFVSRVSWQNIRQLRKGKQGPSRVYFSSLTTAAVHSYTELICHFRISHQSMERNN